MLLYAAEFLFSFRTPWWWPPLFWEQIILQVEYMSVLAVKKPFCVKNCPIRLVFQGEYLLSVYFSRTFPGLWQNLLNLRIFPGLGILCLNSLTFPVFTDMGTLYLVVDWSLREWFTSEPMWGSPNIYDCIFHCLHYCITVNFYVIWSKKLCSSFNITIYCIQHSSDKCGTKIRFELEVTIWNRMMTDNYLCSDEIPM